MKIVFLATGHRTIGKEWTGKCYNEDYARIYCIIKGAAEIGHNGREFLLEPGSFYLIPPGADMRYHCPQSFEVAWFHFNFYIYGFIDIFNVYENAYVCTPADFEKKREDILRLIKLIAQNDLFSQLQAKSLFLELVSPFFLDRNIKRSGLNREKIDRLLPVIDYIDKNPGKPIKLTRLAKMAAYESTYFSTIFKQVFGISPIQYVLQKRIDKAQAMLRNGDIKMAAIAESLGFVDAFHFSKTFKKISGQTPREFRDRQNLVIP